MTSTFAPDLGRVKLNRRAIYLRQGRLVQLFSGHRDTHTHTHTHTHTEGIAQPGLLVGNNVVQCPCQYHYYHITVFTYVFRNTIFMLRTCQL